MSNIIDSILISGTTYTLQGSGGGGGNPTVEVTQAQYDALVSAGTVSADTFYIITDATAGDLSNYYTKSETDDLLDTKLDVSAYTPTDLSNYYTKSETSGATQISTALNAKADTATTYTKTEVDTALGSKQATLVSGTNIKTINNESILGSGNIDIQGGSSINVVQTTGTSTTDVMSQDAVTNIQQNVIATYSNSYDGQGRTSLWAYKANGSENDNLSIFATKINGRDVIASGYSNRTRISVNLSLVETSAITTSMSSASTDSQVPSAKAVYDALQEGGGSSYTAGDGIDITNDVISVTGKVDTTAFSTYSAATEARLAEDEEVTAAALNDLDATTDAINDVVTAHTANTTVHINSTERTNWNGAVTALGGLKLVKLTQAQYDALATKDANTLYIIV